MTAVTTRPAWGTAVRHHPLADAPSDLRCPAAGRGHSTHRFPAATYLCRSVAREERAIAQQALEATDRTAARRTGGLALLSAAVFAAMLVLLATGRAESGSGTVVLAVLAAVFVLLVVALVVVLRRHEREHDALAHRVRMYDARLQELRTRR